MKKLMTIFLALLLMFNTVLTTVASAKMINDDEAAIGEDDLDIEVNDLEVYKRQVTKQKTSLHITKKTERCLKTSTQKLTN